MYKLYFYASVFFLAVVGCSEDDDTVNDCNGVVCTLEFRSYAVTITDAASNPVALDAFQVLDITNNEDLTAELTDEQFQQAQQTGIYPLYGDRFAEIHQNKEVEIIFKGLIDTIEVVNAQFTVGADCCHANILSGNLEIIIN